MTLRRRCGLSPEFAYGHYRLGMALAQQGHLKEAVIHCQHAVRLKPDYANFRNTLGNVLAASGKMEEAIAQIEEAIRLEPDAGGRLF